MIAVNICIFLISAVLAVLSREHYSKYKSEDRNILSALFYSMGETVFSLIGAGLNPEKLKGRIRSNRVLTKTEASELARAYCIKQATVYLVIIFVFNLLSLLIIIIQGNVESQNIIERAGYEGSEKSYAINLEQNGTTEVYIQSIFPLEYTYEEFVRESNKSISQLKKRILGNNKSLNHVMHDLELPEHSEDGVFVIRWISDRPDILSSTGRLVNEEIREDTPVKLTAVISYLDYTREYSLEIVVCTEKETSTLEDVKKQIDDIEKNNRTKKELIIPKVMNGVGVNMEKGGENVAIRLFAVGILICLARGIQEESRLRNNEKKRNEKLEKIYPEFVDHLWLLIGAGMSLRSAIEHAANIKEQDDILYEELKYTLNQLQLGENEALAYEQLGQRLNLPVYVRLMNRLSQGLRMGSNDLLPVMENEVRLAFDKRLSFIKKKGEEVSTLLLFPMIILLLVVMFLIIAPAVIGY